MQGVHKESLLEASVVENFQRGRILIFPTSQAADFWQRRILSLIPGGALRQDRILSWSSFVRAYLSSPGDNEFEPVTPALRLLFLYTQLADFSLETLFVPTSLREKGFLESRQSGSGIDILLSVLPRLPRFVRAIEANNQGLNGQDSYAHAPTLVARWKELEVRYLSFLHSHRMVEPSWAPFIRGKAFTITEDEYKDMGFTLYFSEIIQDFDAIHEVVQGLEVDFQAPETEQFFPELGSSSEGELSPGYRVYQSNHGRDELWWVISSVQQLLLQGVPTADITITLPQYDLWKEELQESAELLGVPITLTKRHLLGDSPLGRLCSLLSRAVEHDFYINDVENLFFHGAFPWKGIEELRPIIQDLRESGVVSLSFDGEDESAWIRPFKLRYKERYKQVTEEVLAEKKSSADLLAETAVQQLQSFFTLAKEIIQAPTVELLMERLHTLYYKWLHVEPYDRRVDEDTPLMEGPSISRQNRLAVDQLCQAMKDGIALIEEEDKESLLPKLAVTPFRILLKLTSITSCNPPKVRGVRVAPYGESAGIVSPYHFIPGASQGALGKVEQERIDQFLRINTKQKIPQGTAQQPGSHTTQETGFQSNQPLAQHAEQPYSEKLAQIYTISGGEVTFSSSHRGFAGAEILYLPFARFKEALPEPPAPDILMQEEALWRSLSDTTGVIESSLLKDGLSYGGQTAFGERVLNLTTMPLIDTALFKEINGRVPKVLGEAAVVREHNLGNASGSIDTSENPANAPVAETIGAATETPANEPMYRFSASSMDLFNKCGFKYLFERLIKVPELNSSMVMRSARVEGDILHRALELLLKEHFSNGGTCYGELSSIDIQDPRISQALDQAVEENWGGHIPNYLRRELGYRGVTHIHNAILYLAEEFSEFRPHSLEGSFSRVVTKEDPLYKDKPYGFAGKIDNLSIAGDELALIDYKRSAASLSSVKDIHELGPEGSVQIPTYLALLEVVKGLHIKDSLVWAGYYSFTAKASGQTPHRRVISPSLRKPTDFEPPSEQYLKSVEEQMERMDQRLFQSSNRMIDALDNGDFRINAANPSGEIPEDHCTNCTLRTLCRTRYVVE